jgi:prepilin-type N-terminal cleavage/methylation domain-containing protein
VVISKRLRAARGFTLAEVVVAILLLTIGVLASASLTAALIRSNRGVTNRMLAAETLQLKVEDLQSQGYEDLASGSDTATFGGLTFTRSWTVTGESPAPNLKTVTMTVTWSDRQGDHSLSNQTIRAH